MRGDRLFVRGDRLFVRGDRLLVRGDRLFVRGDRLLVRGDRLLVRVDRLLVRGDRLFVRDDRLFEEIPVRLSLRSLVGFLTQLCEFSRQQLGQCSRQMSLGGQQMAPPHTSLLLYRLGDVMARCIRTDRPHLHLMRVWSVVSSHFVEVSSPFTYLLVSVQCCC